MTESERVMLRWHRRQDVVESLGVALAALRGAVDSANQTDVDSREIAQLAQQLADVIRRMGEG